jgi:hypothetical protein
MGSFLFDAARRAQVEPRDGFPSRRLLARHGAQGPSRAAPLGAGTAAARSHAQRSEHGEHGEDPPLDGPEHRGTALGRGRGCYGFQRPIVRQRSVRWACHSATNFALRASWMALSSRFSTSLSGGSPL